MFLSKSDGLYREEAINHLNSKDNLYYSLLIIPVAKWWWLLGVLFTLIGIFIWASCAYISISVAANGVVFFEKEVNKSESILADLLEKKQQTLSQLKYLLNKKYTLYQQHLVTLDDLLETEKEYLTAHQERDIYSYKRNKIIDTNADHYQVLVFINYRQGIGIKVGNKVKVKVNDQLSSKDAVNGVVSYVSNYPISKKIANIYLNNSELVDDLFATGAPILVKVDLDSTSYQYQVIKAGEVVSANIFIKVINPLELITSK